jgi:hypothetical protein
VRQEALAGEHGERKPQGGTPWTGRAIAKVALSIDLDKVDA